jgi:hypothetical protein
MPKTCSFCNKLRPINAFVYDLSLNAEICVGCYLKHLIRIDARPEIIQHFKRFAQRVLPELML